MSTATLNGGNGNGTVQVPTIPYEEWVAAQRLEALHYREGLEDQDAALQAQIDQIHEQRKEVQREISRANRVLRALEDPGQTSKERGDRRKGVKGTSPVAATGFGISKQVAFEGAEIIKRMVEAKEKAGEPTTFTQTEFYKPNGWDQGSSSSLFRYLRSIEFVRKSGRSETRADLWALLDVGALDRARAEYEANIRAIEEAKGGESVDIDTAMERVTAYLAEQGTVEGWTTIERACKLRDSQVAHCREKLLAKDLISAEVERGRKTIIHWKGGD